MFMYDFRKIWLVLLVLGCCSASFAEGLPLEVLPFKFTKIAGDSASQTNAWNDLMKYKLWGTGLYEGDGIVGNGKNADDGIVFNAGDGIVFDGGKIHITDSSGYVGSATGDFVMVNDVHSIGGPLVFGGSFKGGTGLDSILIGPSHFGGTFEASFNGRNNEFFAGMYCVENGFVVNNNCDGEYYCATQGLRDTKATIGCDGAIPIDEDLDVPVVDYSFFDGMDADHYLKIDTVIHASSMTPNAYIDVPPGDIDDMYNIRVAGIRLENDKPLYVRMQKSGRLTRVFLDGGLEITNHSNIRVIQASDDSEWDRESRTWTTSDENLVSNKDYAGNLLFYTPEEIRWTAGEKHLQGTFISGKTITIAQQARFAGQLIAKAIYVQYDFKAEDFRYVRFNPSVIDPTLFATVEFPESERDTVIPLKLNKKTQVKVTFDYCFSVSSETPVDGKISGALADASDFVGLTPICGDSLASAEIDVDSDTLDLKNQIKIHAKLDQFVEAYGTNNKEKFQLKISNLVGAVLKNASGEYVREGAFDMYIIDQDVVPVTRDTVIDAVEDSVFTFAADMFPYESPLDREMGGVVIEAVPAKGSLTYFGKTLTKSDVGKKIPADSLGQLKYVPVADKYGDSLSNYEYTTLKFAVYDSQNSVSSSDKKEGSKTLTVVVTPVNDAPITGPATFTISGHVINGGDKAILDGSISVKDVDDDTFTYAFDPDDPNFAVVDSLFVIDENTGKIHVKDGIELNENVSKSKYEINVIVSDKSASTGKDEDILTASSKVTIEIDFNNNPPTIVTDTVHVVENSKSGTSADSSLKSIDKDAGDTVKTYTLVGTSNWFEVSKSGVITVKEGAKIDYEKSKNETLTIQVCDEYNGCSEKNVVVAIVDVPNSKVKIVEGKNEQGEWPNPTTIYTNVPNIELSCTFDNSPSAEKCKEANLKDGCQYVTVEYDNPDLDGAARDSVKVCYSSAAPIVTVGAGDNEVVADNIYTIVESLDEDDANTYVNATKNKIHVTVSDPVSNVKKDYYIEIDLDTTGIPSSTLSTMGTVEKANILLDETKVTERTPVNGDVVVLSYKESFAGRDSVTVSYEVDKNGDIIKVPVMNSKGKYDSVEVYTVSYETVVNGRTVTISYKADAATGAVLLVDANGNLMTESAASKKDIDAVPYTVSYDYVDANGNSVNIAYGVNRKGELVRSDVGDIGYSVSYTYVNVYGNGATQSVFIVLDRVGPKVEITYPQTGDLVRANFVEVTWKVNGVVQDTLVLQSLEKGTNPIIRFYKDKAGNMGADTVWVVMKDAKDVEISVEQPVAVVTKEKVEEYYASNPPKPGETFAVSLRNPSTGKEAETLIGGSFKNENGSGKVPYEGVEEGTHLGPTLVMDVKVPVVSGVGGLATLDDLVGSDGLVAIEGVSAANSVKLTVSDYVNQYCEDGFDYVNASNANLYDIKMDVKIWVYTTLGNFVDYYRFTQELNDPSFVNEAGLLQMFFELKPDKDGYVRAESGKLFATGAYVYKVDVGMKSVLKCTLPPVNDLTAKKKGDIIKTSDDMLKSFGYKRPGNKK